MYKFVVFIILSLLLAPASWAQFTVFSDGSPSANMNAVQALQQMQQRADQAYSDGDYAKAYKFYLKMTKIGDNFSQFRIATMYEDGLHVPKDMIQAYAWSFLAAEVGRKEYIDYHASVKAKLSAEQIPQARRAASSLVQQQGMFANMVKSDKMLRKALKNCTGSHVGNRCDAVSTLAFTCSATNELEGNLECLRMGSLGLTSIAAQPADIRKIQIGLRDFIDEYQPGTVELGDFELIDD